ncbi:MAG: DNA repair photolyase [Desulforhopalus sp.]
MISNSKFPGVNLADLPELDKYPEQPPCFGTSLKLLADGKQLAICHMGFRFDSYMGWCGHYCSYCYARGINMRYKRWEVEKIKVADLDQVKRHFSNVFDGNKKRLNLIEQCIAHRYPIRMGTNTDCFQPVEEKYRVSYRFIDEIMNQFDYPYSICTKSSMVAAPEYLDLYRDNATFQFSLSTLKQDILDKIERGAPPAVERLTTIKKLSDKGFFVGCRISPHIPEYMDDLPELVKRLADAGCKHVISELLRVSPILNNVMIEECGFDVIKHYKGMGAKMNIGYVRYPLHKKIEYQRQLKELCDRYGMTFATCADEDPSFHTVENCCGYDGNEKFKGCPTATYDTAFRLCKEKGTVSFDELIDTGWCPDPPTLKKTWDKGYFENILKNLQFDKETGCYSFVECNETMKRVNG